MKNPKVNFEAAWWPVDCVVEYLHLPREQVLDLIKKHRLDGRVMGDSFLVHGASVVAFGSNRWHGERVA